MVDQIRPARSRITSLSLQALEWLRAGLEAQRKRRRRHLAYEELSSLPDHLLADLGLTRAAVREARLKTRSRQAERRRASQPVQQPGHGEYSGPAAPGRAARPGCAAPARPAERPAAGCR